MVARNQSGVYGRGCLGSNSLLQLILGEIKEREHVVVDQYLLDNLLWLGDILHKGTECTRGLAYHPRKASRSLQFGE
jgi:hypothetical protein